MILWFDTDLRNLVNYLAAKFKLMPTRLTEPEDNYLLHDRHDWDTWATVELPAWLHLLITCPFCLGFHLAYLVQLLRLAASPVQTISTLSASILEVTAVLPGGSVVAHATIGLLLIATVLLKLALHTLAVYAVSIPAYFLVAKLFRNPPQ
jgi:hypothetical protein